MASSILHIKDSYYFEFPKFLVRSDRPDVNSFEDVWVRLDPDYQLWEARRLYPDFAARRPDAVPEAILLEKYVEWKHANHKNAGRPFAAFLEKQEGPEWFLTKSEDPQFMKGWEAAKRQAGDVAVYREEYAAGRVRKWSADKISAYNRHLDGKIIIPQPFGELRNLYESESGITISKFMIIEIIVGLILIVVLSWLGRKVVTGQPPKGRLWNLFEAFAIFIRDQIARPAIDHHDAHSESGGHDTLDGHVAASNQTATDHHGGIVHAATSNADHSHVHAATMHRAVHPAHEGDLYVPLLSTIFFFVLGCNLMGLMPWMGAPTGAWGATFALACVTFATGVFFGMKRFGMLGFFLNQIPGMELPLILAVVIKPVIFAIEMVGLLIKHLVLSIRLLANMVAGHVVLLGIMGIAFSLEGATSEWWTLSAVISLLGSTLLSILELGVAFIQAYIFTFLSALFIGSAIHRH